MKTGEIAEIQPIFKMAEGNIIVSWRVIYRAKNS